MVCASAYTCCFYQGTSSLGMPLACIATYTVVGIVYSTALIIEVSINPDNSTRHGQRDLLFL